MTDTIKDRAERAPTVARRSHRDPDTGVSGATPPKPRFGLTYVVSAAARFDAPYEALGTFLSREAARRRDVDELVGAIHRVRDGTESPVVHCAGEFRCTIGDRVELERLDSGTYVPCSDPLSVGEFENVLHRWAAHLEAVPTQLDDVAAEAAAAQRRVATMSWLESGIAMAAGNGWSHEAAELDRIVGAIADGAREQVGAMSEAGATWSRVRGGLDRRRRTDPQVEAIVSALDQLLGAG